MISVGCLAQKCMKQAFQGMISAIWLAGPRNAQNEPSRAWPAPKRHPGAPRRHPQERPRKHPQARRGPQEAPGGLGGNMCENICVFSAKVARPGISPSVWKGDPHDLRNLCTKVEGAVFVSQMQRMTSERKSVLKPLCVFIKSRATEHFA